MKMILKALSLIVLMAQLYNLAASQSCIANEVASALTAAGIGSSPVCSNTCVEGFKNITLALKELKEQVSPPTTSTGGNNTPLGHGKSPCDPATSCAEIYEMDNSSPSGYYWLESSLSHPARVYCDMELATCGSTKGWMRVTSIDVSNTTDSCLDGLNTLLQPQRLCSISNPGAGCSSAMLNVSGVEYSKVCGKIIGYQQRTPDAFSAYNANQALTIDDVYVDGISLTYGKRPRNHIWTFAAALHEINSSPQSLCPCINSENTVNILVPPFVANDYFCDTGSTEHFEFRFYPEDPLWDGSGCGELNSCCAFNNPSWFTKQLSEPIRHDIEMRLCSDQGRGDEDITFEKLDIYVQ